jgi:hypothetical protein
VNFFSPQKDFKMKHWNETQSRPYTVNPESYYVEEEAAFSVFHILTLGGSYALIPPLDSICEKN